MEAACSCTKSRCSSRRSDALDRLDRLPERGGHRARPELHPDHRGGQQHRAVLGVEQVDPVGDDRVHALRHRQVELLLQRPAPPGLAQRALLDQHPDVLVGVERVAAGHLDQRAEHVGGEGRLAEQVRVERGDAGVAQRRQGDGHRAGDRRPPSSGPGRPAPAGRCRAAAAARRGRPRRAARRSAASRRRPSAGPRRPARWAGGRPARAGTAATPTRSPRPAASVPGRPTSGRSASTSRSGSPGPTSSPTRGGEPLRAAARRGSVSRMPASALTMSASAANVTFSPNGGQRPVRQVSGSSTSRSACRYSSRTSRLLPMPARPKTVTTCGHPVPQRPVQGVDQQAQLVFAVDQRGGVGLPVGRLPPDRGQGQPHLGRGGTPAQGDRRLLLVADRVLGQRVGGAADQHPARRRDRLHPGGGVDHVAGDDGLPAVAGGGHVDQRLAGGHPDPEAQLVGAGRGEPGQHPLQLQPGPHAAQRVGLGGHRGAEQRHHRVADVLLDHAAVLADDPAGGGEEAGLHAADLLRVGPLDVRREVDQVDEEHADPAAVLLRRRPGGRARSGRAAGGAERRRPAASGRRQCGQTGAQLGAAATAEAVARRRPVVHSGHTARR